MCIDAIKFIKYNISRPTIVPVKFIDKYIHKMILNLIRKMQIITSIKFVL